MTPVLELVGVERTYPSTPPVQALRGIDLSIREGELVAVVGPSGSGKSTLLNVMGALDRPTAGDIRVEGRSLAELDDAELSALRGHRIGFVFQQFHLLDALTATENVAAGLLYRGVSPAERTAAAQRSLVRVGLAHRAGHRTSELSGGERQRVAIARAVVGDPAIVLADEPTGNLDSTTSDAIVDLLRELNAMGSTIVVITHDQHLASRLPRQVSVLDGLIAADTARTASAP